MSDSSVILQTVSSLLLLFYFGALMGWLRPISLSFIGLGTVLLLWEGWCSLRERELQFSAPLILFIVLPVVFWLVHAESRPMFWDEYSHWGIYVREMAVTHELWSGETNSSHPDYPPVASLWQYLFTLIPGYGEGTVYLAQFVLLLTPLLVFFEKICLRQWFWVPALLALLALGLANFGQGIVSLYTDHLLSVWYAGILLQAMRFDQDHLLETGLLALPLAVLILIKDAGLPLVAFAIFLIVCLLIYRQFKSQVLVHHGRRLFTVFLLLVCIPLVAQMSWKLNREALGVVSGSEGSGLMQILLTGKSTFSEQELQTYQNHFWKVLSDQQLSRNEISQGFNEFGFRLMRLFKDNFRLTLLSLLLLFPIWSAMVVFLSTPTRRTENGLVLGILFFSTLAYIFVMYRTYPLIHSVDRAQNLVSFLRYVHTISLPMLLLGMGLLSPAFQSIGIRVDERARVSRSTILFGIALLLLYTFETPYLKPLYVSATYENHPRNIALLWRKEMDDLTEKVRGTIGMKRLWVHLPIPDNGFLATTLRYQMTPVRTTVNRDPGLLKKPFGELEKLWDDFDFLWFPMRNPDTDELFQQRFVNIQSRVLKVIKNGDNLTLRTVQLKPSFFLQDGRGSWLEKLFEVR